MGNVSKGCTVSLIKRSLEHELAKPSQVILKRGAYGFGFSVVEVTQPPSPGIYVSFVKQESEAGSQEALREGVQILSVNGQDLSKATRDEALDALTTTGEYMTLVVCPNLKVN